MTPGPVEVDGDGAGGSGLASLRSALPLVLWPLAVFALVTWADARSAGAVLVVGLGIAAALLRTRDPALARPMVPMLALALATLVSGRGEFIFAQPVLVNLAVATTFGLTLRPGSVPLIERFARRMGELPPGAAAHCRFFTWAWFLFASANACIAAVLAWRGDAGPWALWTGPGSYLAIVALFAAEWTVRRVRFGAR